MTIRSDSITKIAADLAASGQDGEQVADWMLEAAVLCLIYRHGAAHAFDRVAELYDTLAQIAACERRSK